MHASDVGMEMQAKEKNEGGVGEESKQCIQSKGIRSAQGRRLHRRVRGRLWRQKINKKLRALQEIIPNCSERGQASILDDAINYIKKMQFQLELMTSMMTAWSTFRPTPWTITIPTGMQIPRLSPFLQMRTGNIDEIKYEIGTGALDSSSSASSYLYPMGLPNSYFLPPPATACQQSDCTRRGGSTARVLPTQIVPSHHHVVEDPTHSGSSDWFSSSDSE